MLAIDRMHYRRSHAVEYLLTHKKFTAYRREGDGHRHVSRFDHGDVCELSKTADDHRERQKVDRSEAKNKRALANI